MKRIVASLLTVTGMFLPPGSAGTAPKPAEIPTHWQLDITYHPPKAIAVTLPGRSMPQVFWYVRYTVTNNTAEEIVFAPNFVLYTDTGEIHQAGKNVPTPVFDAIKKLYNAPLMRDVTTITGRILRGENNAKDGVAIWPDFDPKSGDIDIFIGGLSGETVECELPEENFIEATETDGFGNQRTVRKTTMLFSKTLQLRFAVPGEAASRLEATVRQVDVPDKEKSGKEQWVMR
jgi:hypothetical protein